MLVNYVLTRISSIVSIDKTKFRFRWYDKFNIKSSNNYFQVILVYCMLKLAHLDFEINKFKTSQID